MLMWHIVLLPLVVALVIGLHVLLVRRRGVVPPFAPTEAQLAKAGVSLTTTVTAAASLPLVQEPVEPLPTEQPTPQEPATTPGLQEPTAQPSPLQEPPPGLPQEPLWNLPEDPS